MNLRRPPSNADSTSGSAIYAVRAPCTYSLCLDARTLTGGKLVLSFQTPLSVSCGCPHNSGLYTLELVYFQPVIQSWILRFEFCPLLDDGTSSFMSSALPPLAGVRQLPGVPGVYIVAHTPVSTFKPQPRRCTASNTQILCFATWATVEGTPAQARLEALGLALASCRVGSGTAGASPPLENELRWL